MDGTWEPGGTGTGAGTAGETLADGHAWSDMEDVEEQPVRSRESEDGL